MGGTYINNRCNIYQPITLSCGITLRCQPSVLSQYPQVIYLLDIDVIGCLQVLPSSVHELMRRTKIWVNVNYIYGSNQSPQYLKNPTTHHHESWLIKNLDNPDKTFGIEIYNVSEYIKLRRYWNGCGLLLHEVCHLIHQMVLVEGLENEQARQAYNHVVTCGKYNNVLRRDWMELTSTSDVAYATVDVKECFAEMSVSFLCTGYPELDLFHNDCLSLNSSPPFMDDNIEHLNPMDTTGLCGHCNKCFPFTRGQLKLYDSVLYSLISNIWDEISTWIDPWANDKSNEYEENMETLELEDTIDL